MSPKLTTPGPALRLLSANLQAGATTRRYSDYFIRSWAHALPLGKIRTLDAMAQAVRKSDMAGLQESDSGSWRSGGSHQTQHLALGADMPHWHHQNNRKMGPIACSGNGLLARVAPRQVECLPLPGKMRGRGALLARFGMEGTPETLLVGVVHLSLGAEDRSRQLAVLAERLSQEQHVVLMGDFNCSLMSMEMRHLWRQTQLDAKEAPPTFPSWNPQRTIDHILATPSLQGGEVDVLAQTTSDHLMVTRTIHLPGALVA